MSATNVYEVVVIGAGLSGLCCANFLKDSGVENVLVLEAKERVGGRTYTKKSRQVGWCDLGGSYVGPNQHNILRIAKRLGIKTYKVHSDGQLIDFIDGKRCVYESSGVAYNAEDNDDDLKSFLQKLDNLGKEIPVEEPWTAPQAEEWDQITYKEFVEKNCSIKQTIDVALEIANDIFSAAPHELSLLFVLWYIKMGKGTTSMFSNVNGAQDSKFDGGSMQICERLVDTFGRSNVLVNKAVHSIDQSNNFVAINTLDGFEYRSKYVVMALPPCVQMKVHYNPPLPSLRNQMLQRFPMGSVTKCVVYYDKPFWRENGYCGASTISGNGFLQATYDDSKADGSKPSLMGFIFGDKNRKLFGVNREKRKQNICHTLSQVFESPKALWPTHYEEYDWGEDQYCGGGYTGVCPPGFLTEFGKIMRQPVGNIHFAGTETATEWFGYMDGAVQAGERAAKEVIAEIKRQFINNGN